MNTSNELSFVLTCTLDYRRRRRRSRRPADSTCDRDWCRRQDSIEPPISLDTELALEFWGPRDRRSDGKSTREQPGRGPAA